MSDKYGYIGIETLLNFCSNQKDHCVTPNDFMRMNRVKIDERPHGEWIDTDVTYEDTGDVERRCSNCKHGDRQSPSAVVPYCWYCGADMRKEGDEK